MRTEIRLAGSGGQGLITAGVILAEAAGVWENKHVCQTQSYGPEARGGASRAEVVISDAPIHYPNAQHLDALLALSQEACDRYFHDLKDGGTLIVDADLVANPPSSAAFAIPITRSARAILGSDLFATIAALGALVAVTRVVSEESVEAAMLARVPPGTEEPNRVALRLGLEAGREALATRKREEYPADA